MSNEALKNTITTKNEAKPAVATSPKPTILTYLTTYKDQIAAALPKHLTVERMTRIVITETSKNPELKKCDPVSLFGAVIQCSQLGLEPGNALGHAYLIPFNNHKRNIKEVQLIIGYRGMLDLARRSGQIQSIQAYEVYTSDTFYEKMGLNPEIIHERDVNIERSDEIKAWYAVATLKDGGKQFKVMYKKDIEAIKKQSQSAKSEKSPWNHSLHYNEMAKKTVVRNLFKWLPVSIEIQRAIGLDEMADEGISQENKSELYPDAIDIDLNSPEDTSPEQITKEA